MAYGQKNPNPMAASLLLQSLNQSIDLESARRMALQNRVPESVTYVDGIVGIEWTATDFLDVRDVPGRHSGSYPIIIIDLDEPRSGLIRVSQQPMIDLQHAR